MKTGIKISNMYIISEDIIHNEKYMYNVFGVKGIGMGGVGL